MDDGTIARLSEEDFYVTTTSTGAGAVSSGSSGGTRLAARRRDRQRHGCARGGQRRRAERAELPRDRLLTDLDVSSEGFGYLDAKHAQVTGVPMLLLRSASWAKSATSSTSRALRRARLGRHPRARRRPGNEPFGLEPQRILRLEKMHILIGQDTDSESNVLEASMPWIAKLDKDDFVGKWSLEHVLERGFREQLVGFETESGVVPLEGGQIVVDGRPGGRVTSARWSDHLGRAIGMAWVPPDLAEEDAELTIKVNGSFEKGARAPAALLRPGRGAAAVVTRTSTSSAPTSPPRKRCGTRRSSALAHAPTGIEDLSRTGVLDVRGELDGLDAGDAEIVRLTPERALVLCRFEEAGSLRERPRRRGPAGGRRLRRLA